jgi:hypothetical protein
VAEIIRETLKSMAAEGRIIYQDGWNLNFRTATLNRLLPEPSEKITSWGSYYWFKVNDRGERFRGYLELFGDNIPESSTDNMRKMIGKLKPKDNNDTSVGYKKLLSTKTYNLPELDAEDWDSSVRAMVRDAVMWLLNEEDKALKDC